MTNIPSNEELWNEYYIEYKDVNEKVFMTGLDSIAFDSAINKLRTAFAEREKELEAEHIDTLKQWKKESNQLKEIIDLARLQCRIYRKHLPEDVAKNADAEGVMEEAPKYHGRIAELEFENAQLKERINNGTKE